MSQRWVNLRRHPSFMLAPMSPQSSATSPEREGMPVGLKWLPANSSRFITCPHTDALFPVGARDGIAEAMENKQRVVPPQCNGLLATDRQYHTF